MSPREWSRLALDAAGAWVIAAMYALSVWVGDPVPLWLPFAAYALTAAMRRRSQRAGVITLIVVTVLGTFATLRPEAMAFLVAVGVSLRAVSLRRDAPYWALRAEFMTGLSMLLIVAILRLMMGAPPALTLAAPAALVVAAGLFGLPFVHSLDAVGRSGTQAAAKPGMRLGLLIAGASAALGLLVEGVRLLYLGGHLSFLTSVLYWLSYPFVYLFFWIGSHVLGNVHVRVRKTVPSGPNGPRTLKPHPLSPGAALTLHIGELILLLLVAGLIIYFIYRRQSREEEAHEERNAAPDDGTGFAFDGVPAGPRRARDYGQGARARVRSAVGRHLLGRERPAAETARMLAAREEWPEEALRSYERARYRLRVQFEEAEAASFLQRFREWRRRHR